MHSLEIAREYRRPLEEAVQQHRLLRHVQVGNPTFLSSVMVWTGRHLVAAGKYLEARSQGVEMPPPVVRAGHVIS
jgi:hypothetical protein